MTSSQGKGNEDASSVSADPVPSQAITEEEKEEEEEKKDEMPADRVVYGDAPSFAVYLADQINQLLLIQLRVFESQKKFAREWKERRDNEDNEDNG